MERTINIYNLKGNVSISPYHSAKPFIPNPYNIDIYLIITRTIAQNYYLILDDAATIKMTIVCI